MLRDELLVQEAHQYRNVLESWFQERDMADPASVHLFFQPGYLSLKPLDMASVPRFEFCEPTVAAGLRDALWKVTFLLAETLVTIFGAVLAFQRYDVR